LALDKARTLLILQKKAIIVADGTRRGATSMQDFALTALTSFAKVSSFGSRNIAAQFVNAFTRDYKEIQRKTTPRAARRIYDQHFTRMNQGFASVYGSPSAKNLFRSPRSMARCKRQPRLRHTVWKKCPERSSQGISRHGRRGAFTPSLARSK